jgi:thioredoxin:protein disulfide reductase
VHRIVIICLLALASSAWAIKFQQPLPPEQAFLLQVNEVSSDEVRLEFTIAPGTYLYQKEFKFSADKAKLGVPDFPAGIIHHDPYFGEVTVYEHQALITLPITAIAARDFALTASYQGCNETGFCYPPQELVLPIHVETATLTPVNETEGALHLLQEAPIALALLAFFGFGLLLAFTPCVLPMIPILSSLIIGEQHKHHRLHAFRLALIYVLGMATTYAALGAVVATLGGHVQAQLQHPITLTITAGILLFMAVLLFNDKALSRLSHLSHPLHTLLGKLQSGKTWAVAAMGMLSSLIISPCVTPPLIGALTYISLTGDVFLGALALFLLALGMGVPLLAVAWGGTALLPQRGPWLNYVKHAFAVILVLMALSLLARFILPALDGPKSEGATAFSAVQTSQNLDQALAQAAEEGKPVMLDFYADWCTACISLEKGVFTDPKVAEQLTKLVLLKVDLTDYNEATQALMARYQVYGPPALIFFDAQGQQQPTLRVDGQISPDKLSERLGTLLDKNQ